MNPDLVQIAEADPRRGIEIAEELLDTLSGLFGSLRGGLGISVTLVGMLLAASTGIVGATVVTMGLLSLPTMLRRGYSPEISTGTIVPIWLDVASLYAFTKSMMLTPC